MIQAPKNWQKPRSKRRLGRLNNEGQELCDDGRTARAPTQERTVKHPPGYITTLIYDPHEELGLIRDDKGLRDRGLVRISLVGPSYSSSFRTSHKGAVGAVSPRPQGGISACRVVVPDHLVIICYHLWFGLCHQHSVYGRTTAIMQLEHCIFKIFCFCIIAFSNTQYLHLTTPLP